MSVKAKCRPICSINPSIANPSISALPSWHAGPIANFLLAMCFFWVLAMLGSEQVRPVIGAVESGSIAAKAGLTSGQEIIAIDGEADFRLGCGESAAGPSSWVKAAASRCKVVREQGSTTDSPRELALDNWLKGADEPDPIRSLGIRPWRPALAAGPGRA
jgi:regulator of sigma E protease